MSVHNEYSVLVEAAADGRPNTASPRLAYPVRHGVDGREARSSARVRGCRHICGPNSAGSGRNLSFRPGRSSTWPYGRPCLHDLLLRAISRTVRQATRLRQAGPGRSAPPGSCRTSWNARVTVDSDVPVEVLRELTEADDQLSADPRDARSHRALAATSSMAPRRRSRRQSSSACRSVPTAGTSAAGSPVWPGVEVD